MIPATFASPSRPHMVSLPNKNRLPWLGLERTLSMDASGMKAAAVHERRVALGVTTVGILAATLNASILLISLPAIFAGLGLDPLAPSNISLLLWMLMGYMLVTAVLVVTFGRLGDQYGRARLFNLGFAIFTAGSIACA